VRYPSKGDKGIISLRAKERQSRDLKRKGGQGAANTEQIDDNQGYSRPKKKRGISGPFPSTIEGF